MIMAMLMIMKMIMLSMTLNKIPKHITLLFSTSRITRLAMILVMRLLIATAIVILLMRMATILMVINTTVNTIENAPNNAGSITTNPVNSTGRRHATVANEHDDTNSSDIRIGNDNGDAHTHMVLFVVIVPTIIVSPTMN